MKGNLDIHNIIQVSIPLWVVPLILFSPIGEFTELPKSVLDAFYLFGATNSPEQIGLMLAFVVSMGAVSLPDLDHFIMWRKFKHSGIRDFCKKCLQNDRTRKATLIVHNYVTLFVILPALIISTYYYNNLYGFITFTTFFLHILLDYLTDVLTLKKGNHWKINWRS